MTGLSRLLGGQWFLLSQLVRRDIERRYRGSVFGVSWAIAQPLAMIAIYTVVFGLVFQPRWPNAGSVWDYVLILFLGKIPFIFFSETLSRSSVCIPSHAGLILRSSIRAEVLPAVSLLSSAFNAALALLVWVGFFIAIRASFPVDLAALALLWIPMVVFLLGVSWVVAGLGAYFKDTEQVIGSFNIAMMFLSPIFYPLDSLPPAMAAVVAWNPLAFAIEQSRDVLLFGGSIDWWWWAKQLAGSSALLLLGLVFFRRVRPGFADVI